MFRVASHPTIAARPALAALLVLAGLQAGEAAPKTLTGTILRYECGDNCYLVLKTKAGEQAGLCAAPECAPWNAEAAMPDRFKGRRVAVTVGAGTQYDGAGNAMGEFMSFTKIRFLKK